MIRTFTSICVMTWLFATALTNSAMAAVCSNPGVDGPAAISGGVNSYYPGSGTVSAGSTSISVSIAGKRGAANSIAAGDLIMIMQMQDADINNTNSSSYGGSSSGSGYSSLNNSGVYEYAVVSSSYTTGTSPITITSPLSNSYRSTSASSTAGQRAFQVIRVPQYSSATLTGTVTSAAWNGASGGVVAFDVAGNLSWGGQSISVSGQGFRGGGGQCSNSNNTGDPLANIDYRTRQGGGTINLAATATTGRGSVPNGSKGEGVAGTPMLYFDGTSVMNSGVGGYPNGSASGYDFGRGAPGNAGGGGTDGDSTANDENTGGGGGGAYSIGGMGGYGWTGLTPPGYQTGGFGGYSIPMGPGLLTMGGGGGAGSTNNCTGGNGHGDASSGAPGGGVVIIRTRTASGSGSISANGSSANNTVTNDASGGGGGGGAILAFATNNNGSLGSLTINARGGNGGTNTGGGSPHGPGGGGSGGFVAITTATGIAIDVSAGSNGTTATSSTSTAEYGSTASSGGYQIYALQPVDIPGAGANALCSPLLNVSKTTAKTETVRGGATSYILTVTNASGYGAATGVILSDTLPGSPSAFAYASTDSITLSGGATRTSTSNPAVGSVAPSWGSFSIPGGGSVAVRFTVNVPANTTLATYQNSATVVYDDPTRTSIGQTVTPGGTYAGSGTVPGSNYASASSTLEDVTVWAPATVTKSFTPASIIAGGISTLSISIANVNSVAMNNVAFTDSYPAGLVNTAAPGGIISGSGCYGMVTAAGGGSSVALSGGVIPAGGSCTVSVNVTFSVAGNFTNTIPAGAITNIRNITNTSPASATLNQTAIQPPSVTKTFAPAQIQQGAVSTLALTVANGGTTDLTGIAFSDTMTNMQVATPSTVTNSCGGTLTATAGSSTVSLTNGVLGVGATCTITVQITSSTISTVGGHANTVTGITSTQSGAGANSNTTYLVVAGTPTIAKAFAAATIAPGAATTLTFTITNPGNIALTNATFSDNMGNFRITATGAAGGTCSGASGNTLNAGTSNIVLSGLTVPAAGSCTVTVQVASTVSGLQSNIANGVSSSETPTPGNPSAPAATTVFYPPQMAKSFFPGTIQSGGTSTVTLTLTNLNSVQLDGVAFTDTLTNMRVNAAGAAGGTCSGASGNSFTAAQTGLLTFSGITIPASASCTVTFVVTSTVQSPAGGHPNTVNGATSAQSGVVVAGPSDTAYLSVLLPPTITKVFSPPSIASGGASTIIFTLANPNSIQLTGGKFTDTFPTSPGQMMLTNVAQPFIGGSRGTCIGSIPSANPVTNQLTAITLNGITIPANGSCTIMVDVTSSTAGNYSNITTGMTTAQTPTAGSVSNTATLSVGRVGISKSFSPAIIGAGGTSDITFTLDNDSGSNQTAMTFTDTFPALNSNAMTVAQITPVTGTTCTYSTLRNQNNTALVVGSTGIRINGISLTNGSSCKLIFRVKVVTAGSYPNTTIGVTYTTPTTRTGPPSNTATLAVLDPPTMVMVFSPSSVDVYDTSVMTFTLTNSNSQAMTTVTFTDAPLTGFKVASPAVIGGTCAGVTSSPILAAGDTSLSLSVPNLLPGSCTITIPVTSTTAGSYSNTISSITTAQTGTTAISTSATLTVNRLPLQVTKVPNVTSASPGTLVAYDIGYSNPNATTSLQNVVITDPVPLYTTYDSASCGSLPPGITSCNVSFTAAPAGLGNGVVTWALGGSLPAGSSGTVRLFVRIQ